MGFFDKIKGAMNMVTGNAAKVTIEFPAQSFAAGESVPVRITAVSTGQEVVSKGVFIDLRELESISIRKKDEVNLGDDVAVNRPLFEQAFQIAPDFVLPAGGSLQWEGRVTLPPTAQASYVGRYATHEWSVRGRMEAKGNDPDSGFQPIRVGAR